MGAKILWHWERMNWMSLVKLGMYMPFDDFLCSNLKRIWDACRTIYFYWQTCFWMCLILLSICASHRWFSIDAQSIEHYNGLSWIVCFQWKKNTFIFLNVIRNRFWKYEKKLCICIKIHMPNKQKTRINETQNKNLFDLLTKRKTRGNAVSNL